MHRGSGPLAAPPAIAPSRPPAISVLLVSSGDGPSLRRCLQQVRSQADPLGAEVVLVINAAKDSLDPRRADELLALCRVLTFEPRTGKSNGLNTGVMHCQGEVVAFTDDDAIPQEGWLRKLTAPLLDPHRPHHRMGTGGHVKPVYPDGQPPRWYRRLLDGKTTHFLGPLHDLGNQPHDYPTPVPNERSAPIGANCAYRREVFDRYRYAPELGPNRDTGLRGGEDFELGLRVLLDGFSLTYVPGALVEHPVDRSRMTVESVRQHCYTNGVEWIRMVRMLELPEPPAEDLRRRLAKRRKHRFRRAILDPFGRRRRAFKACTVLGMLDEIERAEAAKTSGGESEACPQPSTS